MATLKTDPEENEISLEEEVGSEEKNSSGLWYNEHICAYCGKSFIGTSQWVYKTRRKWACCYTHLLRLEEQNKLNKKRKSAEKAAKNKNDS